MAADQVKRLVEAALRKAPAERAAYLEGLSELEPDLRKEVESRLASGDSKSTIDKSTAIRPISSQTEAPDRIGPYRIRREIGEGGMGIVYEAEQEKPVRR